MSRTVVPIRLVAFRDGSPTVRAARPVRAKLPRMGEVWHGDITWAKYRDGHRLPEDSIEPYDLQIVSVPRPSKTQVDEIGRKLECDPQIIDRAHQKYQRARTDRHGDTRFLVLRPAKYDDRSETVAFGEVQMIAGPNYVVILARTGLFDLTSFLAGVEKKPEVLKFGPLAVVHSAIDAVVDAYEPVVDGLENDIDEIEDQVFQEDADPLRRIYELIREVMGFQRAVDPLASVLGELMRLQTLGQEEHRYLHDAHERALHASERAATFRALLENVLNVNLALETKRLGEVSIAQNDQTKKISAWGAILFTPTFIAGIYGMNFDHMPELHWQLGYPFALGLMAVMAGGLFLIFKKVDWL
jgi:magnesium transporter